MFDMAELDEQTIKAGGRFKLTVVMQRRLQDLVRGAPKLVEIESRNLIDVVWEEFRQGKVELVLPEDSEKDGKK